MRQSTILVLLSACINYGITVGLCSTATATAAEVELLRDGFEGATSRRFVGTAALIQSRTGAALKLEGQARTIYAASKFPREAGCIELHG